MDSLKANFEQNLQTNYHKEQFNRFSCNFFKILKNSVQQLSLYIDHFDLSVIYRETILHIF